MSDRADLRVVAPGADPSASWETREDWLEAGRRLGERSERDRWALGDWACHGERKYGDLAGAAAGIGIAAGSLRNLATVARKVELSRRRDSLSWSHHAAVAALPAEVGDDLLDRAEAGGWSRETIREEAHAASDLARARAEIRRLRARLARAGADGVRDEAERARRRLIEAGRGADTAVRHLVRVLDEIMGSGLVEEMHGLARPGLATEVEKRFNVLSDRINEALDKHVDPALTRLRGKDG